MLAQGKREARHPGIKSQKELLSPERAKEMPDEITESAKAVQESAKTVRAGIEATQQLGSFVSRITTEPLETVMGILNDKLQFMRWERKLRLAKRRREILGQRGIEGPFGRFLIN